jgi:alkylation response protein AidB-like acyl-CoA dehydrogenase
MKMNTRAAPRQANVAAEDALITKMIHAAGQATAADSPLLHAAIGLAERIRAAGEEIERARRLPPAIAAAMKNAGMFGLAMPRAWDGPEMDPLTQSASSRR